MFHKGKQFFNGGYANRVNSGPLGCVKETPAGVGVDCLKVISYSLLVVLSLCAGKLNAEGVEVNGYHLASVSTLSNASNLCIKKDFKGFSNGVEFFKQIHSDGPFISAPNSEFVGNYSPDKRNDGQNESSKGLVGAEPNNELTPQGLHNLYLFLFMMLAQFFVMFLVGDYLSFRGHLRREWSKHIPKGHPLKVPTLALMSYLSIPLCIKSRRWQVWEERAQFRDTKVCDGLERAYRSAWYWKKLVAEKWR